MSAQTGQTGQADQESFTFQAEVVQILDLMVHSLYSNKEIFLRELISNASDATDRLRLELMAQGETPEEPLRIRVGFDPEAHTITIADSGTGMSPQTRQRLFDAFYTTKSVTGTGLGLWVTKGIVDRHRGTLMVRSSQQPPYRGTVFSLFLPFNAAER